MERFRRSRNVCSFTSAETSVFIRFFNSRKSCETSPEGLDFFSFRSTLKGWSQLRPKSQHMQKSNKKQWFFNTCFERLLRCQRRVVCFAVSQLVAVKQKYKKKQWFFNNSGHLLFICFITCFHKCKNTVKANGFSTFLKCVFQQML